MMIGPSSNSLVDDEEKQSSTLLFQDESNQVQEINISCNRFSKVKSYIKDSLAKVELLENDMKSLREIHRSTIRTFSNHHNHNELSSFSSGIDQIGKLESIIAQKELRLTELEGINDELRKSEVVKEESITRYKQMLKEEQEKSEKLMQENKLLLEKNNNLNNKFNLEPESDDSSSKEKLLHAETKIAMLESERDFLKHQLEELNTQPVKKRRKLYSTAPQCSEVFTPTVEKKKSTPGSVVKRQMSRKFSSVTSKRH